MIEKYYNIKIIRFEGIANSKLVPILSKFENIELVAFCDLIWSESKKDKEVCAINTANVYID